jgi:hypothetical protein
MRLYRVEYGRSMLDWIVADSMVDAARTAASLHGDTVKAVEQRDAVTISESVRRDIVAYAPRT